MDYLDEIAAAAQSPERFIRAVFSGVERAPCPEPAERVRARSGQEPPPAATVWLKVSVRPVQLARGRMLQATYQSERKEEAHNFAPEEARAQFAAILSLGFSRISLQCADGDTHVRITRKGKVLVSRGKPSAAPPASGSHDRRKERPLGEDEADPFLEKLGIARKGKVLPSMRDKFRQINQFLTLLGHSALLQKPPSGPVRIVDCGCGRAFLTFAAFHFLKDRLGLDAHLTGVDIDAEVIRKAQALKERLGYEGVELVQSRVSDYRPPEPPHIVLSLHACDTATDEAIAQGVKWGAELILCAPCCQHELHKQLDRPELRAALRHGILRERTADIMTDAFRAAALRVMGYGAEVIEFIEPDATAKNLMIRAEKGRGPRRDEALAEYEALKKFWNVTPEIEKMVEPVLLC